MSQETDVPVVWGRRDGNRLLVWCEFCGRNHIHSRGADGYRHAHCHNDASPYADGYLVRELTNVADVLAQLPCGEYQDRNGCWHPFTLDRWRPSS